MVRSGVTSTDPVCAHALGSLIRIPMGNTWEACVCAMVGLERGRFEEARNRFADACARSAHKASNLD